MPRFKMIDGEIVQFTKEEEVARDAEEKAWLDATPTRLMVALRRKRDALLAETDYMALSDVTMTDAWKTYRQALRDITSQTPTDDSLSNITFPTKPTE
jgi:hypothetical protein